MATSLNPFFSPTQISSCQLWFDAADVNSFVLAGQKVLQWNDKSGNNRNAIPRDTAYMPIRYRGFNGLFTVESANISGGNGNTLLVSLNRSNVQGSLGFSFFYVNKFVSGNVFIQYESPRIISLESPSRWDYSSDVFYYPSGFTNTSNNITNLDFNVSISTMSLSFNGAYLSTYTTVPVFPNFTNTMGIFGRGGANTGLPGFGQICEIILYNRTLDTSTRDQINGYLAWKWGLQSLLPASSPYKTSFLSPLANPSPSPVPLLTNTFFSPRQISGLQLWLDATDVNGNGTNFQNGSFVSSWVDKSGSGNNASQVTAANRPIYGSVNARSAVVFTGSPTFMTLPNITSVPVSIFLIQAATQTANNTFFVSLGSFPNAIFMRQQFSVSVFGIDGGSGSGYLTSVSDSNTHIWSFTLPAAASGVFAFDGSVVANSGFTLSASNTFVSNTLGAWNQQSNNGNVRGGLSEMIMYNAELSTAQRQQVEGYLAWKWGLQGSLPSNHPYKRSPFPPLLSPSATLPARAQAVSFVPTQFSGCQLWLDAADTSTIVLSGTAVSQWKDKSGNGRNTSASVGSPQYVNNGVLFNGSTTYFTISSLAGVLVNTYFSIFIVEKQYSSGNHYLFGDDTINGNNSTLHCGYVFSINTFRFATYANDLDATVSGGLGPTRLFSLTLPSYSNRFIRINGALAATHTNNTFLGAFTTPSIGRIFSQANSINHGIIYEIIVFTNDLSISQIQQVEGYLAWKWGIQGSLPANHPWKRWPPPPS